MNNLKININPDEIFQIRDMRQKDNEKAFEDFVKEYIESIDFQSNFKKAAESGKTYFRTTCDDHKDFRHFYGIGRYSLFETITEAYAGLGTMLKKLLVDTPIDPCFNERLHGHVITFFLNRVRGR